MNCAVVLPVFHQRENAEGTEVGVRLLVIYVSISGDPDNVAHDLGEATLLLHIDSEPIQNSYYAVAVGCAA